MTVPGSVAEVLAASTVRLREAFAGILLPPRANGSTVTVVDSPPENLTGLPAAWAETGGGSSSSTRAMNVAVIRYLIVPAPMPADAFESSVAAAVDALEETRVPGRWRWNKEAITVGGVDVVAVVVTVETEYPSTC